MAFLHLCTLPQSWERMCDDPEAEWRWCKFWFHHWAACPPLGSSVGLTSLDPFSFLQVGQDCREAKERWRDVSLHCKKIHRIHWEKTGVSWRILEHGSLWISNGKLGFNSGQFCESNGVQDQSKGDPGQEMLDSSFPTTRQCTEIFARWYLAHLPKIIFWKLKPGGVWSQACPVADAEVFIEFQLSEHPSPPASLPVFLVWMSVVLTPSQSQVLHWSLCDQTGLEKLGEIPSHTLRSKH